MKTTFPNQELIDFATDFSQTYKILSDGTYCSNGQNYRIRLVDDGSVFVEAGRLKPFRYAQIEHSTKAIYLDKKTLISTSDDFVFYIILWCVSIGGSDTFSFELADNETLEFYRTTNRSLSNISNGYLEMLKQENTKQNNNRLKKIILKLNTN